VAFSRGVSKAEVGLHRGMKTKCEGIKRIILSSLLFAAKLVADFLGISKISYENLEKVFIYKTFSHRGFHSDCIEITTLIA